MKHKTLEEAVKAALKKPGKKPLWPKKKPMPSKNKDNKND